jgi:hypothetical protein
VAVQEVGHAAVSDHDIGAEAVDPVHLLSDAEA